MSIGNIVEAQAAAKPATAGRVNFGLDIRVGSFRLNEWAFSPAQAKIAHERLLKNGNKPFEKRTVETLEDGTERVSYLTVRRAVTNDLTQALAED